MAEESPRPETDGESEEEGEEATEAPVLEERKKEDAVLKEAAEPEKSTEESPAAPEPPPKEKKVPVQAPPLRSVPRPLLPTPPPLLPAFSLPVYPALPQPYYPAATPSAPAYSAAATTTSTAGVNAFANDGSFLELFKKKMEKPSGSKEEAASPEEKAEPEKRRPISFVGKRRGGAKLALKTGMVAKKPKTDDEEVVVQKGGAWAQYMAEVKKYKAHQCSDDDKTRPLVK